MSRSILNAGPWRVDRRGMGAKILVAFLAVCAAGLAEARDPCERLPDKIELEAGRYVLERQGDVWVMTKGTKPPRSFVYADDNDGKRIYEFRYRINKQYGCTDTNRQSGS